jgi:hypothetical protein
MGKPDLSTLIDDIYQVIAGNGGWDQTVTKFFADELSRVAETRFEQNQPSFNPLRLSAMGQNCKRKLWYKVNQPASAEPLNAEVLGTFFYGDVIETMVLALAKAAGHDVQGEQDKLTVCGIEGHRDCVIDGVTVDVKSASKYGFQKFAAHNLRNDDPFGYISQLSSYVYAAKDDPLVTDKTHGAFLVVQKDRFKLCLDKYDFAEEIANKEREIEGIKKLVEWPVPPDRMPTVPQSKTSPNKMLGVSCNYCEFRKHCWPEARTFIYSTGPVHLVKVDKVPNVPEAK